MAGISTHSVINNKHFTKTETKKVAVVIKREVLNYNLGAVFKLQKQLCHHFHMAQVLLPPSYKPPNNTANLAYRIIS
jgi:hypothetical protein